MKGNHNKALSRAKKFMCCFKARSTRRLRVWVQLGRFLQQGAVDGKIKSVSSDVTNCCGNNGCQLSGGNFWNPVTSSYYGSRYAN